MRWSLIACLVGCVPPGSSSDTVAQLHNVTAPSELTERPTVDEMQATVTELSKAEPFLDNDEDAAAAVELLGTPFWFDGFEYVSFKRDPQNAHCTQRSGTLTTRQDLDTFVACLEIADWKYSGAEGLSELDITHVPSVFAAHRARLADLARDHTIAFGHLCPAAPGDFWTMFAATKHATGDVTVDTILVFNDEGADCRYEEAQAAQVKSL